ncbi:xanthine dehydrogenase family protein molybdopterin-binding subunit [Streptomyces odontomachi]|uniref:xanthine dehydrogenase family protein molybdopterin-binding subunit n=1 Tax=Streptomyces odontomachi TaxID=2944940 RepID=UPI00210C74A5|nr:xanthine dehydrogenase family protein molybdopterin-binding subunit [Streptomyces sp. ODS25]
MTSSSTGSPVGRDIERVDGRQKVTGRARYAADQHVEHLAYAALVLSTVGKGRIRTMDTDAAAKAPGVLAVHTPFAPLKLYAGGGFGESFAPLQDDTVRYRGQIIGMVVADTFERARDAAQLIRADYDTEPVRASLPAGLPGTPPPGRGPAGASTTRTTVLADGVDSIEDALDAGEITVQTTVTQPVQHHAAMEPHATTAVWHDDHVTVYCGTQAPGIYASGIAGQLGVEPDRVRVVSPFTGGGFGGKSIPWGDAALTAAAARALGRPVKLVLAREQVFTLAGHRSSLTQTVRLAASRDGVLSAVSHTSAASYSASGGWVLTPASGTSGVFYATPNLHVDERVVTLDVPAATAMRAPGEAPGSFALETAMDELAVKTGIDPVELRLRNHATTLPGTQTPWSSKYLKDCYRIGAERFGWHRRAATPRSRTDGEWLVGTGMATAVYPAGRMPATVRILFRDDGTATVASGAADIGTGAWTVLAIVAADALGLPLARIEPRLGDSSLPPGAPAFGSMTTGSTAPAVQAAAADAIDALRKLAADTPASPFHGQDPADLRYHAGRIEGDGGSATFVELLAAAGTHSVGATSSAARGDEGKKYAFHSFGAHFCEVRVNRYTGEPRVSRFTTVVDVGRVVNARTTRSQLIGGVIFGIGHALLEADPLEEHTGRLAAANLGEYLVPAHADIPPIDVHWLDHPDTVYSAFGARGLGELGTVGSAAAVANAVYNATGLRVRDLPITLDKLLG